MAGEAGRGFAVVADEVQRLAERAGQATRQVDALVRGTQADAQEAVDSMEQSTAGVVGAARLAEQAGQALDEIQSVSGELAERIEAMAELTRRHFEQSTVLRRAMDTVRATSRETLSGTLQTADAVEELKALAEALRASVAGFRLPEREFMSTLILPSRLTGRAPTMPAGTGPPGLEGDEAPGGGVLPADAEKGAGAASEPDRSGARGPALRSEGEGEA